MTKQLDGSTEWLVTLVLSAGPMGPDHTITVCVNGRDEGTAIQRAIAMVQPITVRTTNIRSLFLDKRDSREGAAE